MPSLSRLSPECAACPFVRKCKRKRMVEEAYLMPASAEMVDLVSQPMAVKHDYRDIKITESMTITIDVEELKEQMRKDFYRKMGIGFYPGA